MIFLVFVMFGVSLVLFGLQLTFGKERRAMVFVNTPQQAENIPALIKEYGFDKPFYIQYGRWVKETVKLNFGYSYVASDTVWNAFWRYFPITLELNMYASPLIIIVGVWLGTLAGIKNNSFFDHFTRISAIIGWSLPTFLFSLFLLMIFYGYLQWLPPDILSDEFTILINSGAPHWYRITGMPTIDGILNGRLDVTLNGIRHLVMPIAVQIIVICAVLMRVMRSGMLEEMGKDYVITVRAKGADNKTVNIRHARRNALLPVITVAGQMVAALMEGSIAVEIIFNRQGIGWWLARSAIALDMPVLMSMCLVMAIIFVTTNLIVDILYAYIDPRIRLN